MIITCEKCNARYLLASLLLGVSGRKVRCGVCGNEWFQESLDEIPDREDEDETDEADVVFDDGPKPDFRSLMEEDHLEPIPEGVKPVPEGSSVPVLGISKTPRHFDRATMHALMGVAVMVLLIVTALVAIRDRVVQFWQPAALMYDIAGISTAVPGDGLIFDRITAKATPDAEGQYHLVIDGSVINLHARQAALPKIRVTLRRSETEPAESWIVALDRNSIGPEETVPFQTTFDNLSGEMKEVNVRFVVE